MSLFDTLIVFSSVSFLIYGSACFSQPGMKDEFTRYGLDRLRTVVGALEVLGALGLLVGLKWSAILLPLSSGGLGLLMFFAFVVRLKIKDGFWLSMPSFFYMALCFYIFARSIT